MSASYTLSLGGLNKVTGKYVYPKIANKAETYVCPDCNKDLTLCQGDIRIPYFRHKVDAVNPCNHYSSPSESQIHKDAKLLMKELLDSKTEISMVRACTTCHTKEEFEIPKIESDSAIEIEHRFTHNGGTKIADVAYLNDGELFCIFEICHTHKTDKVNRPDPWFEINAKKLITSANDRQWDKTIGCMRCELCSTCLAKKTKYVNDKATAVNMVYDWLNRGKDIKPFIADYDVISSIHKNTTHKSLDISADIIVNIGEDDESYGEIIQWGRYIIQLVYDASQCFAKCSFTKELEFGCSDGMCGIYYVDINWVLAQTSFPKNIQYIAGFDKYDVQSNCTYGSPDIWVKRRNVLKSTYTVTYKDKFEIKCQRCEKKEIISRMENNRNILMCCKCDVNWGDKLFIVCAGCDKWLDKNYEDTLKKQYGARLDKETQKWYVSKYTLKIEELYKKGLVFIANDYM